LTKQAIEDCLETRGDYAVRRVMWVTHCYLQENMYPTRRQLVEKASVRDFAKLPKVKQVIDEALQLFGHNHE